ncbi:H-NS histone family protein [Pelomonas sp. UHG3]|uniref:H-NS histone family protein n=1 Tax=Roseateles hydrophilus TaxID=2975054 RepID=A0ACC6CAF0_9BURK|nr:H-NS histone family protein [Pelomonas sp. UHG3]MCY4745309.1 H-NS histone family protein [Pelomonas sp. UHG3]
MNSTRQTTISMEHRMAKSLQTLLKQIAQLQKQADALRSREKSDVIDRIKEAIAHYDITADELFGGKPARVARKRAAASQPRKAAAAKKAGGVAKYTDGAGRTWSGVGKRPNWFKDALAAGKTAEDLLISR